MKAFFLGLLLPTVVACGAAPSEPLQLANLTLETAEDTRLDFVLPISGDTQVGQSGYVVLTASLPAHGVLQGTGPAYAYLPHLNYHGPDQVTITAQRGAATITATVGITVRPVTDPVVANNDQLAGLEDTAQTWPLQAILGNDVAVDGAPLTITKVSVEAPAQATLGAGTLTFTPAPNQHGPQRFRYDITDGQTTATAEVTVTVAADNDAPTATADQGLTAEDSTLSIASATLLANDIDVDGDTLFIAGVLGASQGTATLDGQGELRYTPTADFHGTATVEVAISDGALTTPSTLTIQVTPVNDPPVARADVGMVGQEDAPLIIPASALLANDTDIDGDTLQIIAATFEAARQTWPQVS